MAEFAPILLLLFAWIFVGLPISMAKKAANQKKQVRPARPGGPAEDKTSEGPAPAPAAPERLRPLTPTLSEPDHDDSVFTGSLGAFSTEGCDPCHDEQMRNMEPVCKPGRAQEHQPPAPQAHTGLPLGWTGSDMVRGVVMSEILNRKR